MTNTTIYPFGTNQQLPSSDNLFTINGILGSVSELPETGKLGDAWLINGDLWIWIVSESEFQNAGPFRCKALHGASGDRPTPGAATVGLLFFDETLGKLIISNGESWINIDGTDL